MTYCKTLTLSLAVASASLLAFPASALTITYGGQLAGDGSALTSNFVPANNIPTVGSGYFVETFDPSTAGTNIAPLLVSNSNINIQPGCSVNFFGDPGITTTFTGGGLGVQTGSNGAGAAPAGNTTCYGFGPAPAGSTQNPLPATTSASIKVDYSNLLTGLGARISYLGLYYGSIDTYNDIVLYDGANVLSIITGSSVLAALGGISGNQIQAGSNVYVNFDFLPGETFTGFRFETTNVAFEVDNVVIGLDNRVPEPGSLALFAAALLGFAATRRWNKG